MLGAIELLPAHGRDDLPDRFPPQMTMNQSLTKLSKLTKTKIRDRRSTRKKTRSLIERDFTQNLNLKRLYLRELRALCERPLHIHGFMHNPG